MAHGSALGGLGEEGPEDLIPGHILCNQQVNYLALGHHHSVRLVSEASMPAYYSGSPEMLAVDQKDAGHVLHVILEERAGAVDVSVDRVRVGKLRYHKLEVEAAEIIAGRDLEKELDELSDPDLIVDLAVHGLVPLDAPLPDFSELNNKFSAGFFKIRMKDQTSRTRELSSIKNIPESSVLAEFIRRAQQKIDESEESERAEWEDALRLGIHYLVGSDQ